MNCRCDDSSMYYVVLNYILNKYLMGSIGMSGYVWNLNTIIF